MVTINMVGNAAWNVRTGNGQHLLLDVSDLRELLAHDADHADEEHLADLITVLEAGLPAPVAPDPFSEPDLITDAPAAEDTWRFGSAAPEDQPEAVTVASTRPAAARTLREITDGVGTQILGPNGDVLTIEEIADMRSQHAAQLADQVAEQIPHPSADVTVVDEESAVWRLVNGIEQAASVLLSATAGYRSRG